MLDGDGRAEFEKQVRERWQAGDYATTATMTLRTYGPELLGYLHAVTRDETDAGDAFATFSEDLWRGLPDFRWHSTLRTWVYILARHALTRLLRDPQRRWQRNIPLSRSPVYEMANHIRTTTLVYLRTEVKDELTRLREELDPEDQELLVLRVSREMSWREVAEVLSAEPEPTEAQLERDAARWRKRFQRVKQTLAEMIATKDSR